MAAKRICVCVGPGGVGKTSTSAALALGFARRGKKTLVVTIDPARRLADALGIELLGNEPERVELDVAISGELWAMMLNPQETFDELIEELSHSERERDETLSNGLYRELSGGISGSQEFTAIEKLYELDRANEFDLIVLDTPPSRNALDFLDAPDRLESFFSGRALNLLGEPSGLRARVLGGGASLAFAALKRVTGADFLDSITSFFKSVGGMSDEFSERTSRVKALLREETTGFVLIATAGYHPVSESIDLAVELQARGLDTVACVANQVHKVKATKSEITKAELAISNATNPELAGKLSENLSEYSVLAARDRDGLKRLREGLSPVPVLEVPFFDDEAQGLPGLTEIENALFTRQRMR